MNKSKKWDFESAFESLTGNPPFPWQKEVYRQFEQGICQRDELIQCDIPTGLGKTMVIAIWLIARMTQPDKLPPRLIYVVDRRTVVDQATDIAENFAYLLAPDKPNNSHQKTLERIAKRDPRLLERKKQHAQTLGELRVKLGLDNELLAISTLRGQLADNREWSRDPSRTAIIIGTVDLIGSALLFSGYRSSYKRRPLEAGLLGQDSLLVLDEAHLSKPFEKLLGSISEIQKSHGTPMRVIRMSATASGDSTTDGFRLKGDFERRTGDFANKTLRDRYGATKHLTVTIVDKKDKLTDKLARKASELAEDDSLRGKRIVVFVRKPEDAKAIANTIREHIVESVDESGPKAKKIKQTPYVDSVKVLTGTMRGLERDELVEEPVFKERWLNGDLKPDAPANQSPVFLVSTSAGEVGFDLNADHMVCDATTIDSLIQRLGRVNRRGLGDAEVHLITDPPKKEKDGKPKKLEGLDLAIANTIDLLQGVTNKNIDVSLRNLAALRKNEIWKAGYEGACSPSVPTVELTDILLDAWSMTSINQPMPGRPEVGPWLRGLAEELPQTTIAWRAELDESGFADLDLNDVEEWFDTHRVLTHETLSVPTSIAEKWLKDRWDNLDDTLKSDVGRRSIIVDRSGLKLVTVKEIVDQLVRKNADSIRYAEIILPASFGGIERRIGLLDAAAPKQPEDATNTDEQTRKSNVKVRLIAPDVADVRGHRYREIIIKHEDGETESSPLVFQAVQPVKCARYALKLESDDDRTVRLVSYVPRLETLETGSKQQTLKQHVGAVRKVADSILSRLPLSEDIKLAAQLAADWHDHGKARERWQRLLVFPRGYVKPDEPMGKSGGDMRRDSRGYRHEFGSLREFTDAFDAEKLLNESGKPVSREVFDLALHLIATHHGRGRPHFPKGGFDPDCESRSENIHTESIRRFARLQRKYGWWRLAWLENLLRCADALASADQDAEDDPTDGEGVDP